MARQTKRAAAKERRRDRLAQAKADAEVREEWLEALHGDRDTLVLIAGYAPESKRAREAVLRSDEVPDGVTHALLRKAAARALGEGGGAS
jgi:hypothetical protein